MANGRAFRLQAIRREEQPMSRKGSYHRRTALLTALALVLLFGSALKDSLAYFTTYTTARGGWPVTFGPDTELKEEVEDLSKTIQIENNGDSDCFVRVRAYFGEGMVSLEKVEEEDAKDGAHWRREGDWWYYDQILKPGGTTCKLKMTFAPNKNLNTDQILDTFHVVIVQESAPVLYRQNGDGTYTPYAEWGPAKQEELSEEAGS